MPIKIKKKPSLSNKNKTHPIIEVEKEIGEKAAHVAPHPFIDRMSITVKVLEVDEEQKAREKAKKRKGKFREIKLASQKKEKKENMVCLHEKDFFKYSTFFSQGQPTGDENFDIV